MRRIALAGIVLFVVGCGSERPLVEVPSNAYQPLDRALRRLQAAGLRASFPSTPRSCGSYPTVSSQSPRAPARVRQWSVVTIHFQRPPEAVFLTQSRHSKFTRVPRLVGREALHAIRRLQYVLPCVQLRGATATASRRVIVVAQQPKPGTRVRAVGVTVSNGFRPTIVNVTIAVE